MAWLLNSWNRISSYDEHAHFETTTNAVQFEMASSRGPPRSSGAAAQHLGGDKANAIDLTSLNDSDSDIPVPVENPPKPRVKIEPSRESSSDENDIVLAMRTGKRRLTNIYRGVKRKQSPENEKDAAVTKPASSLTANDSPAVNTSLLLNIDRDELKCRKRRRTLKRHIKTSRPAHNIHSQGADSHRGALPYQSAAEPTPEVTHAQQSGHKPPLQSITLKPQTQAPLEQRDSSAGVLSNSHRAGKTCVLNKKSSNSHSSKVTGDGPRQYPAPLKIDQVKFTPLEDSETQDQSGKAVRAVSHLIEDEIYDATAQFQALQAQRDQRRKTQLVDIETSRKRAVPSSFAQANAPSRPPPPHQPPRRTLSGKFQLPRHQRPRQPGIPPQSQPRQPRQPRQPQAPRQYQPRDSQPSRQQQRTAEPDQLRSRPRPAVRAEPINGEEFQNAAALMRKIQARQEQPKQTTLIDSLPTDFHESEQRPAARRAGIPGQNVQPSASLAFSDNRVSQRRRRIELDVNRHFAHESEEQRARMIEEKFNNYLIRLRKREAAPPRPKNDDYLTIEDLKAMRTQRRRNEGYRAIERFEPTRDISSDSEDESEVIARRVPLSQAFEATDSEFVTQYIVLASEPHEGCGEQHRDCLRRRKAFDELESANAYAEQLLKGPSRLPRRSSKTSKAKRPRLQINSYQETYEEDGKFSGLLKLTNGQSIFCEVRKECQAVGTLDPSTLRKKWAKDTFVQVYRKRYDVWLIKVVPTAFLEREQQDEQEKKKKERESADKEDAVIAETHQDQGDNRLGNEVEERVQVAEGPITTALEGDELRIALANLPSPTTTQPDDTTEDTTQDDDSNYDAASEASDISISSTSTLQNDSPPSPQHHIHPTRCSRPNPWLHEEYQPILCGSYTDLRLANEKAFSAAKLSWVPRTANMNAWEHYEQEVQKAIEREREVMDLDGERADIVFPVPAWHGHDDRRPWGFVHSRVMVQETVLEGPRDIGAEFVREEEKQEKGREPGEVRGDDAEAAQGDLQAEIARSPLLSAQDPSIRGGDDQGGDIEELADLAEGNIDVRGGDAEIGQSEQPKGDTLCPLELSAKDPSVHEKADGGIGEGYDNLFGAADEGVSEEE